MKLGVFTCLLSNKPFDEVLQYLKVRGIQTIELACGGYVGNAHCNPAELLADPSKLAAFKKLIGDSGMSVSTLSVHGNPVHPDKAVAASFHKDFENTVLMAEKLGVNRVVTFSGCPGDSEGSKYPNWVTCPWPDDFLKILDYQWNEVLIPYWEKTAAFARNHGVTKIALEMHPGFCVYNTETLLRLRAAVGPEIGANLDPSHLFWQGMDPCAVARELKDAVQYVHAKDSKVCPFNAPVNGVLDTKHYADEIRRSWIFRSVGYGHDKSFWNDFISNLRMIGYDDVLSIEHEDSLMTPEEGLDKAIAFLKEVLCFQAKGDMWWA
jgi:sugar phosphate isomerase/epimerase